MKDFGYDVSDYRDVDPMFGTLADFDALIAEAHRLGLQGDDRPGDLAHRPTSIPGSRRAGRAATNPKADWYVWADAKPDGTPPNNWLSIFGGSAWQWDTRRACSTTCTISWPSSPTSTSTIRRCRTRCSTSCASGSSAASTASASTRSTSTSTRPGLEDNPALPAERAQRLDRAGGQPLQFPGPPLRQEPAGEPRASCERFRALLDEYPAAAAVGEVGDAQRGLEVVADYTAGGDRVHMCYAFDFLGAGEDQRRQGRARCSRPSASVASDGWSCWAFSNHDVMRHVIALGRRRGRPARLSQGDLGAADVAARLGLPLPGRGARPDRGRARLRGSAGSLRHPLLAGVQGPRRLPHADGVGDGKPQWRLLDGASPGCRCRPSICALAVDTQQGDPTRCSSTTGASWRSAATHPALAKGEIEFLAAEGDALAFTRAAGQRADRLRLQSRRAAGDDRSRRRTQARSRSTATALPASADGGKIRLGRYGAWFGAPTA